MAATSTSTLRVFKEGEEVCQVKYIHLYSFNVNCGKCGSNDISVNELVFKCLDCGNEEIVTAHIKKQ